MDPRRVYDYLMLARERVFGWVGPLSAEQYGREFAIGRGTLARTLTHIMMCEWYYVERLQGHPVAPYEQWPIREERPPAFAALEAAWMEQVGRTRAAIGTVGDWTAAIEYEVTEDDGRRMLILTSAADIFTQLVLHEVHHRAQALNMLRHLGVTTADIDFNALVYQCRPV